MGKGGDAGKDAVTVASGNRMIFDHLSVSWGPRRDLLDQRHRQKRCGAEQHRRAGLQTHSCGGLHQPAGGISLMRNLYIDNKTRNPKVKGVNEFTNNVVYNWSGGGGYIAGGSSNQSRRWPRSGFGTWLTGP